MKVYLVGVGLGNPDTMTVAARRAIEESPLLIGAPRLLEGYEGKTLLPLIAAADIAAAINSAPEGPAAVLLSGDVGFYSGARNLYPLLQAHQEGRLAGAGLDCVEEEDSPEFLKDDEITSAPFEKNFS